VEQCGVVVGIEERNALVSVKRDTACGKCKACPSNGHDEVLIRVLNSISAQPGDRVAITMESSRVLKAAAIAYFLPLVGLIVGVFLGTGAASQLMLDPELLGLGGGVLMTLLTFLGIKLFEPYFKLKGYFEPKIIYMMEKFKEGEDYNGN